MHRLLEKDKQHEAKLFTDDNAFIRLLQEIDSDEEE